VSRKRQADDRAVAGEEIEATRRLAGRLIQIAFRGVTVHPNDGLIDEPRRGQLPELALGRSSSSEASGKNETQYDIPRGILVRHSLRRGVSVPHPKTFISLFKLCSEIVLFLTHNLDLVWIATENPRVKIRRNKTV